MNRHGSSRHFRVVDNIGFLIQKVASDYSNHADGYSYKTFRCNRKHHCGLLPAFRRSFSLSVRVSVAGKSFPQPHCRGNDGTTTASVRKMRVDSNTAWRAALKRAGIDDFRFHDLRHSWASWLIQAGVPLSALQEMGGWESIEMVRRYAHLAPNHLTEHARKIDSLLGDHDTNTTQGGNQVGLKLA